MVLVYKFKKEKLLSDQYVYRPRILIRLHNKDTSLELPALIDSGCDTTVIPESIANILGLDRHAEKHKLYGYRESSQVQSSVLDITLIGRGNRESVTLNRIPVLITLAKEGINDEEEIVLGINGIFDAFDITFKKSHNQIILKRAINIKTYK